MVKEELSTSCACARVGLEETSIGQLRLATRNIEWMILWFENYHFFITLLHFDQKSDGRIVGFSTLPCRMYDTMIFLSVGVFSSVIRHLSNLSVKRQFSLPSVKYKSSIKRRWRKKKIKNYTYRPSLLQHGRRFTNDTRRLMDRL